MAKGRCAPLQGLNPSPYSDGLSHVILTAEGGVRVCLACLRHFGDSKHNDSSLNSDNKKVYAPEVNRDL